MQSTSRVTRISAFVFLAILSLLMRTNPANAAVSPDAAQKLYDR